MGVMLLLGVSLTVAVAVVVEVDVDATTASAFSSPGVSAVTFGSWGPWSAVSAADG